MMGEMKLSRDWLCEVKADLHGARQICGWTCIENVHNPHVVNSPTPEWNPRVPSLQQSRLEIATESRNSTGTFTFMVCSRNMLMAGVLG